MRIRNILTSVAAATLLGGCANQTQAGEIQAGETQAGETQAGAPAPAGSVQVATAAWAEPDSYKFTLTSSCGERALIGRFKSTVKQGLVVETVGLDDSARRALMLRLSRLVPTLGQLAAQAETARKAGADTVVIKTDPTDGHPTSITIDPDARNIDDEQCYEISDYSVG